jgi:hypothetical protein
MKSIKALIGNIIVEILEIHMPKGWDSSSMTHRLQLDDLGCGPKRSRYQWLLPTVAAEARLPRGTQILLREWKRSIPMVTVL